MRNSEVVLEYDVIDDSGVEAEDATEVALQDGDAYALERVEETDEEGSEIEGLRVAKADDPTLGLTNRGVREAQDWAADTGPSREPERRIESDYMTDKGSTLGPDGTRKRSSRS